MRRTLSWLLLPALLFPLLAGCTSEEAQVTLRVGLLPVLEALPFYVAQEEGYFAEQGLEVTFVPVASAAERDQLLVAGQVDVVIDDLISLLLLNRDEVQVVAVRTAMRPTAEFAQFRLLAAPQSTIRSVEALRGLPIGVSEGTIIEYVTERLLEEGGLPPEAIHVVAVPRIPDRMALLESGELQAATLPEPLASLAVAQGASVIADDRQLADPGGSLIAVRASLLDDRPQAVRAMLIALEKAVAVINADKGRWGTLLSEQHLLPPALAETFTLPDYPAASVPSPRAFEDARRWLKRKHLHPSPFPYETLVRDDFLP